MVPSANRRRDGPGEAATGSGMSCIDAAYAGRGRPVVPDASGFIEADGGLTADGLIRERRCVGGVGRDGHPDADVEEQYDGHQLEEAARLHR